MCVSTCMWESVPLRIGPRRETADVRKTSGGAGCVDPEMWDEKAAMWLEVPRLISTSNEACVTAVTADSRGRAKARRLSEPQHPKVGFFFQLIYCTLMSGSYPTSPSLCWPATVALWFIALLSGVRGKLRQEVEVRRDLERKIEAEKTREG